MLVLCSNHSSRVFHEYAKQHLGKLGWMLGPSSWKIPREHLPFALDNDAFSCWINRTEWNENKWIDMLTKSVGKHPMFAIVPDVVANRDATLSKWKKYYPIVKDYGFPTAFAVQDGMSLYDVPQDADWVFIGGTTIWKWKTLPIWCKHFDKVHVGRVTTRRRLESAESHGAKSCDGTGFFRGSWHSPQGRELRAFVEGIRDTTGELFAHDCVTNEAI